MGGTKRLLPTNALGFDFEFERVIASPTTPKYTPVQRMWTYSAIVVFSVQHYRCIFSAKASHRIHFDCGCSERHHDRGRKLELAGGERDALYIYIYRERDVEIKRKNEKEGKHVKETSRERERLGVGAAGEIIVHPESNAKIDRINRYKRYKWLLLSP